MRARIVRNARGVTLLEMLVSLALMVLVSAFALPRLAGSGAPPVRDEIERLRAVLALASEQAVLRGADLGIGFSASGYRVFEREHPGWRVLETPRAYRAHAVAPGLSMALAVEDRPVAVREQPPAAPQVVAWSSGEVTAFTLTLGVRDEGRRTMHRLVADADGALLVQAVERTR